MHELKLALGKDDDARSKKSKSMNKSKSDSMWVINDDIEPQQPAQGSLSEDKKYQKSTLFLESKLTQLYQRGKKLSKVSFDLLIKQFQQQIGEGKPQITYLLVIQDKITDLSENYQSKNKKNFFQDFIRLIEQKITEIRNIQKKHDLLEYEKIIKTNFKEPKPQQKSSENTLSIPSSNLLGVQTVKQRQKSGSRSKSKSCKKNIDQKSIQKKPLGKLLSKQPSTHVRKRSSNSVLNQQFQGSHCPQQMLNHTAIVIDRHSPDTKSNQKSNFSNELQISQKDTEPDSHNKDDNFVFFRPKKSKDTKENQSRKYC